MTPRGEHQVISVRTAEIRGKPARKGTHSIAHNDEMSTSTGDSSTSAVTLVARKVQPQVGATKEHGLPWGALSVASPILRLFPNLASNPDVAPLIRLYSVTQFG